MTAVVRAIAATTYVAFLRVRYAAWLWNQQRLHRRAVARHVRAVRRRLGPALRGEISE